MYDVYVYRFFVSDDISTVWFNNWCKHGAYIVGQSGIVIGGLYTYAR